MPTQPSSGPKRILVVEHDPDCLDTVLQLLALQDFEVRSARDGAEAIGLAPGFRPDVVLLDIRLPKVDGYEVAATLRRDPATSRAWIVAVTGVAHNERSTQAGIDVHLVKPVAFDELCRAIDQADAARSR